MDEEINILKLVYNNNVNDIKQMEEKISILKAENINIMDKIKLLEENECKTIEMLYKKLDNYNQMIIFDRIMNDKEYAKIYLSDYTPVNMVEKKKYVIGNVKVLGTLNSKKNIREEYTIKIFRDSPMFWCSCSDHKFNSKKNGTLCKHISFLICKVGKIFDKNIFNNNNLNNVQLNQLLDRLQSNDINMFKNILVKEKYDNNNFKHFTKTIDDNCPICFNEMTESDKDNLSSCPTCCNYIHTECVEIWLERKNTCALCRSDVWKHYKK